MYIKITKLTSVKKKQQMEAGRVYCTNYSAVWPEKILTVLVDVPCL